MREWVAPAGAILPLYAEVADIILLSTFILEMSWHSGTLPFSTLIG